MTVERRSTTTILQVSSTKLIDLDTETPLMWLIMMGDHALEFDI